MMTQPQITDRPQLSCLEIEPKLILWTIRHIVQSARDDVPMPDFVHATLVQAGLPMIPKMLEQMLHTLAGFATRRIVFGPPNSPDLQNDEIRFVSCINALRSVPTRCGCHYLRDMVDPDAFEILMPRLILIVSIFAQTDLDGMGAMISDSSTLTSSLAIH